MLKLVNRFFVALLLLMALGGVFFSIITLFIPEILGNGFELRTLMSMDQNAEFVLVGDDTSIKSDISPYQLNYTIRTPRLNEFDQIYLEVYSDGRFIGDISCLEDFESFSEYEDQTEFTCTALIPYDYGQIQEYMVFATLYGNNYEYVSDPSYVWVEWSQYERYFWSISIILIIVIALAYLLVLFPLTLVIAYIASKMKHKKARPGQYTILSLLDPFANAETLIQKFNSFLVSPYFWAFEITGILIILFYMLLSAQVWKSETALIAFVLSGLLAFIVPYLWCAAWWYADFREREPLRLIITFFLWGMMSALMSIGINSGAGLIFEIIGIGFLGTFLIAPFVEEFYKGIGLSLLAEHREFDSITDGLVFGFIIGMGFSFIEDWVYMLSIPMGSDIFAWSFTFFARSLVFSTNHGLYTAIIGGCIGFLIERGFRAPALGFVVGVPLAAIFHAVHNSGETLLYLFGIGGMVTYCCLLLPLFDYGGLILLIFLFIWTLFRPPPKKKRKKS